MAARTMPPLMANCSLRYRKVSRANERLPMFTPHCSHGKFELDCMSCCCWVATGKRELCDKVILEDAIAKLQKAASLWRATGQPFFLATGFRKPHTPWRFPAPFLQCVIIQTQLPESIDHISGTCDFLGKIFSLIQLMCGLDESRYYNKDQDVDVALHGVLDKSVPDIAISSFDFQDPYTLMSKELAMSNRLAYYASVSWMDHQVGRLLDSLDSLGLSDDTVVAFHAE